MAHDDPIISKIKLPNNEVVSNSFADEDEISKWAKSDIDREVYLRGIKGDLKTWVRVLRDFYYPQISKNFTEKQKKDIMQRFKQVSECTKMTPYIPMR